MQRVFRSSKSTAERGWLSQLKQMLSEGEMMSGSLVRRKHTCGKKYCRCMKDKEYRHSSWYVGRSIHGKIYMRYIPHEQIKEIKGWMKRYKIAKELLRKLGDASWKRINTGGR
jgi:hypothetical protein